MKKICLIMLNIRTAQDYRKNLYSIFGNSVTIDILSFNDYSKEKVSDVDLFLLHNNYLLKEVDFPLELPMGVPVVDIRLDFNYRSLQILEEFPQLLQIGMDNIEWIPFSSSRSWYSDVDVLITPGEPQILPDELKSRYPLVDIGARSLAPHVIDEIIEGLNLEFVRNWSNYKDYVTQFPLRNQRDNDLIDTSLEVRQGIEALSEILDEGVVTVNEFGKIISFNQKAAEALKVVADDVIGKTAWDFSEEIFGGLKDFKDTGAIPMHREISRGKERLDFHFHPLIKEGVYRGTLISWEISFRRYYRRPDATACRSGTEDGGNRRCCSDHRGDRNRQGTFRQFDSQRFAPKSISLCCRKLLLAAGEPDGKRTLRI